MNTWRLSCQHLLAIRPVSIHSFQGTVIGLSRKHGSFTRLSLNTTREDCLLALVQAIVSFQLAGLRDWRKHVPLNHHIYHVGGGASEAYTRYKQSLLKDFEFIQLGETALKGAAKLGLDAIEGRKG